jgi:tetratricopeptide (TPR) repeat protein
LSTIASVCRYSVTSENFSHEGAASFLQSAKPVASALIVIKSLRMGAGKIAAGLALATVIGAGTLARTQSPNPQNAAGSEACAGCHSEIYKSYSETVMAKASGPAADGVVAGEFNDKISGVRYRVYTQPEQSHASTQAPTGPSHTAPVPTVWMSYERASEKFQGQRELLYFIGSGRKGRSYLFSVQGFLFETPINWYSQENRWRMTPAYAEAREIPMNLPAFTDCLNCHSSGLQPPAAGTENKFSGPPFLHGGITCQRCHGAGEGHGEKAASTSASTSSGSPLPASGNSPQGHDSIVNPAKLSPDRRDAICMECHFEGKVAVEQPGKRVYDFQPGERLSDYLHYFLLSGNDPQKPEALSQFEALSLSECKRQSGDRMWCGSCHDPHAQPAAENKAEYYRGKCLACHGEAFGAKHHPDKPDCTKCHMPPLPSKDVAHTEGTDHRIQRYPNSKPLPRLEVRGTPGAPLVSFPERDASLGNSRDFALAWETLAQRNVENAGEKAEQYLWEAVKERPEDPVLLAALGFVQQKHGNEKQAREFYEKALKLNPLDNEAATNLGILEARSGNLRHAVELWQGAFNRVPYLSPVGMNLALAFCISKQNDVALKLVNRVLEFNPDYGKGKQLLALLQQNPPRCSP